MLVCIAGTDGSGKSTLAKNLHDQISLDMTCKQLRLYDTVLYPKMQKRAALLLNRNGFENTHYNMAMAYLMYELEEKSYPNLINVQKENEIVILDRYLETIDFIVENYKVDKRILTPVLGKFVKPDVYIYLKVKHQVCYKRIIALRIPGVGEELHEIEAAVRYYDSHVDKYGFEIVDGEQSIEELSHHCYSIIQTAYKRLN